MARFFLIVMFNNITLNNHLLLRTEPLPNDNPGLAESIIRAELKQVI
jgi:hypothetical protein